jgi:hypothetical protein
MGDKTEDATPAHEALPISNPLANISCLFTERKWMRAAKAWRCSFLLPVSSLLAATLTSLIEDKVHLEIKGLINMQIAPVFVVDVPSKGKRFSLVLETCYEHQATYGPKLTALTDTDVIITLSKYTEEATPPPKQNHDPLTAREIQGLHVGFFRSETFWEYLELLGADRICSQAEAKEAFKKHMGVDSCSDIPRADFTAFIAGFNLSLKGEA